MKVEIEGVNQHLSFNGSGRVENYLVVALVTGERITVQVGDGDLKKLLDSANLEFEEVPDEGSEIQEGARAVDGVPPPPAPPQHSAPQPVSADYVDDVPVPEVDPGSFERMVGADVEPEQVSEPEEKVVWEQLGDNVLPESMKAVMRELSIAPELPMSALVKVTDNIAERMMAQATLAQPPKQAQAEPQRTRVMNAVPPRRTVPTNEMGYPQVAGMDQDPGEFAHDADEDGVSQL